MKNKKFVTLFMAIATVALGVSTALAGGPKVKSGDLKPISSEKLLKVEFDYTNMQVGEMSEKDYVDKKVNEYNAKEPGKGDHWKDGWYGSRLTRFEPKFLELFNTTSEGKISISQNADAAKYKLIVKVVFIEPGFNVGVMKKPAYVNFEFAFYDIANPAKPICELLLDKVPGSQFSGADYDAGSRIAESFAKGAKELSKYVLKNLK